MGTCEFGLGVASKHVIAFVRQTASPNFRACGQPRRPTCDGEKYWSVRRCEQFQYFVRNGKLVNVKRCNRLRRCQQ